MAQFRHLTLTLDASVQNLGTAALAAWGPQANSVLIMLELQPHGTNNAPVYVGGFGPTITSSIYGIRLEAGDSSDIPPAPWRASVDGSPALEYLKTLNVLGSNAEVLHVLAILA